MPMRRRVKIDRGYATIVDVDGCNYRNISEKMTELGFKMNHSSARNYVLRAMNKFATHLASAHGIKLTEVQRDQMIRSPNFQSAVRDLLQKALETRK